MYLIRSVIAELKKEYKNNYLSMFSLFTVLLWPILMLITVYYTYLSFDNNLLLINMPSEDLLTYLLSGFMGYGFFRSMVSSAWGLSRERFSGILELIFMSPRNKLIFIYGRTLSSIIENIWLFLVFSVVIIIHRGVFQVNLLIDCSIVFFLTLISATIWGGFLNSLFLLSRDSTFLYNVFQQPMELLSSVRFPVELLSQVLINLSYLFPLSFLLKIIRSLLFNGNFNIELLIYLLIQLILLFLFTAVIMKYAEKRASKTGEFNLF